MTKSGETSIFSAEDQATWTCNFAVSGSNALLLVIGAADNNITWQGTVAISTNIPDA